MRIEAPYHEGELTVQTRVGVLDEGRRNGAAIADSIIKGALKFIAQQPMAVIGSIDRERNVWASVLLGRPGFLQPEDDRTVLIDLNQSQHAAHDPLWANIQQDPRIGMLIIELATRRRLRINGRVSRVSEHQIRLDVDESYPNCPKYIQRRRLVSAGEPLADPTRADPQRGRALLPRHQSLFASADTLFVASANPSGGGDASHRGGNPGFVRVLTETMLRIPDYVGNSMFNTLGNFVLHPHAGVALMDFNRGSILQLIGRPTIQWDADDVLNDTGGTNRYWDFQIEQWQETELPHEIQWELLDYSPMNPKRTTP